MLSFWFWITSLEYTIKNEKMKNSKLTKILAAVILFLLPFFSQAQLLKGTVQGNVEDIQLAISRDGDVMSTEYIEINVADDGSFSFDTRLMTPFNDVILYIGENTICGAHLENGKILEVMINKAEDGSISFTFEGDHKVISEFYSCFAQAYDMMRYLPMDVSQAKTYKEYREILADETVKMKKMLSVISDKQLREYYTKMIDATDKSLTVRLIQEEARKQNKKNTDFPEFAKIIDAIDVNDEISMRCGLSFDFIGAKVNPELENYGGDMTPYCLEYMDVVDRYVTNVTVKKVFANTCAYTYFTFGKGGDYMAFWEKYKKFARDFPDMITRYEGKIEALTKTAKGKDAFDVTMFSPEGKLCKLSDYFGKFLYIDVWATWCGPCCAEIPYLEKLVAHFKGDDRVRFISISVDANKKAWLDKLEKDKPEWSQFILSSKDAATFQEAWGISGIPRFIMIDNNGKIFEADAMRPSDEGIIEFIEEQIK